MPRVGELLVLTLVLTALAGTAAARSDSPEFAPTVSDPDLRVVGIVGDSAVLEVGDKRIRLRSGDVVRHRHSLRIVDLSGGRLILRPVDLLESPRALEVAR